MKKRGFKSSTTEEIDTLVEECVRSLSKASDIQQYMLVRRQDLQLLMHSHWLLSKIEGLFSSGTKRQLTLTTKIVQKIDNSIKGSRRFIP